MNSLSDAELQQFFSAIHVLFERVRIRLIDSQCWQLIHRLQGIEQLCQAQGHHSGLATSWGAALQQISEIQSILHDLEPFDELAGKLAQDAAILADLLAPQPTLTESHEALARRLFSMHNFLDGVTGTENFGAITADRDADLKYGLGLGLKDGSLLRFFSRLTESGQNSDVISRHFAEDSDSFIEAVQGGQTSLEQYMQSQMILRFDPVLSRKVYSMSDTWQSRFNRLGKEPTARAAQIDLVAGERFKTARNHAKNSGIQSLRGFAMLFDLDMLAPDEITGELEKQASESQKCMSLADEVISRMHGHIAAHWQNRLSTVMRGSGFVDHRYYDETQFLGDGAAEKSWNSVDFSLEDEHDTPQPCSGHTYVICPGDRLSQLVQKAYGSEGDYRLILRQNPQIRQPENLQPGMRIYFPEIHHIQAAIQAIGKDENRIQTFGKDENRIQTFDKDENRIQTFDKDENRIQAIGKDENRIQTFDKDENRIQTFDKDGNQIQTFDKDENRIQTFDKDENRIQDFDKDGNQIQAFDKDGNQKVPGSGKYIQLGDRQIGPLNVLTSPQIELLKQGLQSIASNRLSQTIAFEMPSGIMISCGRTTLFISNSDNTEIAERYWPGKTNPLRSWALGIAAQIRGDVDAGDGIYLPLASIGTQSRRREWISNALHQLLASPQLMPLKLILHAKLRCVDIADCNGQILLRLEKEDFDAIRKQPWRRLTDFVAPPIVQLEAFTQLWLGDLFRTGAQIAVPPLVFANQYTLQQHPSEAHFIVPIGTPVYPMMQGTVTYCGKYQDNDNAGYVIVIRHQGNILCKYTSLATINVTQGQTVTADTMIARSGSNQTSLDSEPGLIVQIMLCDDSEASGSEIHGTSIDYFDFVYNIWPASGLFESIVGS